VTPISLGEISRLDSPLFSSFSSFSKIKCSVSHHTPFHTSSSSTSRCNYQLSKRASASQVRLGSFGAHPPRFPKRKRGGTLLALRRVASSFINCRLRILHPRDIPESLALACITSLLLFCQAAIAAPQSCAMSGLNSHVNAQPSISASPINN